MAEYREPTPSYLEEEQNETATERLPLPSDEPTEPTEEPVAEETPVEETPTEELDVKVPGSMGLEYQTTDGKIDKGKPVTGPVERALYNIPGYKQFDQGMGAVA